MCFRRFMSQNSEHGLQNKFTLYSSQIKKRTRFMKNSGLRLNIPRYPINLTSQCTPPLSVSIYNRIGTQNLGSHRVWHSLTAQQFRKLANKLYGRSDNMLTLIKPKTSEKRDLVQIELTALPPSAQFWLPLQTAMSKLCLCMAMG